MRLSEDLPRLIECGDDYWFGGRETIDIIDDDPLPEFTGLLDADGNRIMRRRTKLPIGFCR